MAMKSFRFDGFIILNPRGKYKMFHAFGRTTSDARPRLTLFFSGAAAVL